MSDPILIIGAGVSGLTLAQGLLLNNVPFRIFERDYTLHGRRQGYRFRVSEDGIEALRQTLSPERLAEVERRCCAKISTSSGNAVQVHLDATTADSSAPLFKSGQPRPVSATGKPWSVDRAALRSCLSSGLGSKLEFGKQLRSHEESNGGVSVTFEDGTIAHGRLLVGADGTWSKTRSLLSTSAALVDTEGRLIYGKTLITDALTSKFSTKAASEISFIRDPEQGLSCLLEAMHFDTQEQDTPEDYVYWVLFSRKDGLKPDEELLQLSEEGVSELVRSLTARWHPSLRCLFDNFSASLLPVTSVRPPIPSMDASSRVTLIGDAIHAMAPTAAFGATAALRDAGILTKQLVEHDNEDVCSALRLYEAQMKQYSEDALQRSLLGGKVVFGMRPFDELPEIDSKE